jgi:MFS family permease
VAYRQYVLGVLTLVYTLNYLDRVLIIILLQPIKENLHLSDTQLGFLTGIAFGLFYATLGLPIARWADTGNRVTITSIAIGLWSVAVMSCLLVSNFIQLVLARVAAAVGEAGCMPPSYSLVGDYFPKASERTRAMGIYWMASPVACLFTFSAGGWLNERYGWRATFFLMGLPALLVAPLVKTTITEPRTQASHVRGSGAHLPGMGDVMRGLWRQQSCRHLSIAIILLFTMGLGMAPWYAAFMMRTHGMGTAELGFWLGVIFGVGGITGIWLGGYVSCRWFANDERKQMRLSALTVALLTPCFVAFLLLPEKYQALIALAPLMIVFNIFTGPSYALMQRLVVDEMRATAIAVVMMLANLIGMGLGPQVVGALSDRLMPVVGGDSLRYAMCTLSLVALWSAFHFWQVGRTVREDLAVIASRMQSDGKLRRLHCA